MFDYFAVLISVILGLALIHLLRGLAKLIQMRHEITHYWVHIVWTFNVIIYVLGIWWGMFWWRGLQELNVQWFFFLIAYAVLQFMWAAMLYPPEFSRGMDFQKYFLSNKYWFFGIQLAVDTAVLAIRVFRRDRDRDRDRGAKHNHAADLRGALPPAKGGHFAITDPKKVGELLRAIDGYEGR